MCSYCDLCGQIKGISQAISCTILHAFHNFPNEWALCIVKAKLNKKNCERSSCSAFLSDSLTTADLGSWVSYAIHFCVSCKRTRGLSHRCYCPLCHNSHKGLLTNFKQHIWCGILVYAAFQILQFWTL